MRAFTERCQPCTPSTEAYVHNVKCKKSTGTVKFLLLKFYKRIKKLFSSFIVLNARKIIKIGWHCANCLFFPTLGLFNLLPENFTLFGFLTPAYDFCHWQTITFWLSFFISNSFLLTFLDVSFWSKFIEFPMFLFLYFCFSFHKGKLIWKVPFLFASREEFSDEQRIKKRNSIKENFVFLSHGGNGNGRKNARMDKRRLWQCNCDGRQKKFYKSLQLHPRIFIKTFAIVDIKDELQDKRQTAQRVEGVEGFERVRWGEKVHKNSAIMIIGRDWATSNFYLGTLVEK